MSREGGDSPQARGLIEGLSGVGHVIMDAACDADHLRSFIADELGAMAHIKRNPTRREDRPIDWMLYKERHLVECFFNNPPGRFASANRLTGSDIKRFRRIALRCEKTVTSFKAFVDLACAIAWIS